MAEYYAVLKKAVGGLAVDSSDARRAVYEKARNALIGQLKAINPPLTTSEISRQRLELEEAIRRVEREAGADYSAAAPPTAEIYEEEPEEPEIEFDLDLNETAEPAPRGRRNREHQEAFHQAVQVAERAPRAERREAPPAPPIKGRARNEPSFDVRAEPKGGRRGGSGGRGNDYAPDVRATGGADVVPPEDRMRPSEGRRSKRRGRDEREAYGEGAPERGSRLPGIILTVVILGVLAGLGALAYANRDIIGDIIASFQGGAGPSPVSVDTTEGEPLPPADSTVRDVGGDAGISAPNQEIARAEPGAVPALPGARQKAILYEESRAQAGEVVASLEGGVSWRYIASSPNGPVIEATLSIPERGLSLVMTIRKNLDTEMPASHLVEITAEGTELPGGGIDAIPRLVMKPAEEQKGTPLAGTPTKVVDGLYWIALAGGPRDTASNVSIMRSSTWFDLPLLYKSGQRAILTFEKGAAGQEAFDKALAAWGN